MSNPLFGKYVNGTNIKTEFVRVPTNCVTSINNLLHAKLKLIQKSNGQLLDLKTLITFQREPTPVLPLNSITLTKSEVESLNLRTLGWLAYKLKLQDSAKEIKKADQSDVINQICVKMGL